MLPESATLLGSAAVVAKVKAAYQLLQTHQVEVSSLDKGLCVDDVIASCDFGVDFSLELKRFL